MHPGKAFSRRELLYSAGGVALARAAVPTSPVAIARCRNYGPEFEATLRRMFDQIGGLSPLVKGKTVAIKLNLTGNPVNFPERYDMPFRTHPGTVLAVVHLMARAGARRIRILESFFPASQDLALWARYGIDVQAIGNVGCRVEWENVQNLGQAKQYTRLKVPWGGYVFPAFDLNHSFADCDVYVSMSKLKNHWVGGVTMALKNNFGNTPCSLYGSDCGSDGNENPKKERGAVCHNGTGRPPRGVPQELHPESPREQGYRVPRIVVDLVGARPIDLAIVDGIRSIRGGEGVWNPGTELIEPALLLVGRNPVCTDAVGAAVMGYDPRGDRGAKPFLHGDNSMKLAEAVGIGTTELSRIEVAGLSVKDALYDYGPGPIGKKIRG
jgi:uncharacterized protein (DUF362 family)